MPGFSGPIEKATSHYRTVASPSCCSQGKYLGARPQVHGHLDARYRIRLSFQCNLKTPICPPANLDGTT